jgi:hypothetical protein
MREIVRHGGRGSVVLLSDQPSLLGLLAEAGGGKVCEHLHHAGVFRVESFIACMSHDEDGPARSIHLPGKQNAIGHDRSFHAEDLKETL